MRNLTDEMRAGRLAARTVGEMQGDQQFPPERLRKGRVCRLTNDAEELLAHIRSGGEWRPDNTAESFVLYAPFA